MHVGSRPKTIFIAAAKLYLRHQSQFNFMFENKEAETICVLIESRQKYAIIFVAL